MDSNLELSNFVSNIALTVNIFSIYYMKYTIFNDWIKYFLNTLPK